MSWSLRLFLVFCRPLDSRTAKNRPGRTEHIQVDDISSGEEKNEGQPARMKNQELLDAPTDTRTISGSLLLLGRPHHHHPPPSHLQKTNPWTPTNA
jgi:hypothetical protein